MFLKILSSNYRKIFWFATNKLKLENKQNQETSKETIKFKFKKIFTKKYLKTN